MKLMRAVTCAGGSGTPRHPCNRVRGGGRAIGAAGGCIETRKDRLVADRQAPGAGDHPRRQGISENLQGSPDARRAGESREAARGRQAPARAFPALRREAAGPDRKIRRQLAPGLHRTGRPRKRQPHRVGRQDPHVRLHGHQDHPEPRPRLEGERRRQDHDDLPAQRRQVVRRQAVHGGRFHVLVRRHLSQQEHRPHAVLRVPDRRQGRQDEEDRRLHRRLRISRALLLFRLSACGQHGHRRRVRHARRLPELRRRLRAGPLSEAVPAQVLVRGGGEQEGQGSRFRQLGVAAQDEVQLGAQQRTADDDALEDGVAHQYAHLVDGEESVLLGRRHRGKPASLHRPDHDDPGGEHRGREPAGDRRRIRHSGTAHASVQAAGIPGERKKGQLHRSPRPGFQRIGCGDSHRQLLHRRSRDFEAAEEQGFPPRACPRHRPRPAERGVLARCGQRRLGSSGP